MPPTINDYDQSFIFVVISTFGIVGHVGLLILTVKNAKFGLKPGTLGRPTWTLSQAGWCVVSARRACLCAQWACRCASGIRWSAAPNDPSRARWQWLRTSTARSQDSWPFTWLALTRFTAAFFLAKHTQWTSKKWLRILLCLTSFAAPIDYNFIGNVSHILRLVNVPDVTLGVLATDDRLDSTWLLIDLYAFIIAPFALQMTIYAAILIKPCLRNCTQNNTIQ